MAGIAEKSKLLGLFKSFKKQLTNGIACSKINLVLKEWTYAIVAQLVERHLAKVEIAGSSPVYRSSRPHEY